MYGNYRKKYGCPEKFETMIGALYTGMMANVSVGGEDSELFSVTNGVTQCCALAPTFFSIFLSGMVPLHDGLIRLVCHTKSWISSLSSSVTFPLFIFEEAYLLLGCYI